MPTKTLHYSVLHAVKMAPASGWPEPLKNVLLDRKKNNSSRFLLFLKTCVCVISRALWHIEQNTEPYNNCHFHDEQQQQLCSLMQCHGIEYSKLSSQRNATVCSCARFTERLPIKSSRVRDATYKTRLITSLWAHSMPLCNWSDDSLQKHATLYCEWMHLHEDCYSL
jgi:hypothetical protein